MPVVNLRLLDESTIDPATDAAIRAALCACFPRDADTFGRTRAWHGSAPAFSAILEERGQVIAHAGVVDRTILAGDEAVRVAGVQNVCILPGRRGQGLSAAVLAPAMEEALRRGMEAGLLFCLPALEPLYARLGWRTLPSTPIRATRASGDGYWLDARNVAMYLPLSRPMFPAGPIDLAGEDW